MQSILIFSLVVIVMLLTSTQAKGAYVGPGAGIATIGTVIALVGGILLAIMAFVWYPIKRLVARIKKKRKTDREGTRS